MPMGIDESNADRKHLDKLGKEMLDAYLDDAPNDTSDSDDEEDTKDNKPTTAHQPKSEHLDRDDDRQELQDKEDKNQVKPNTGNLNSSFNGDMKQFHQYLIDRLGESRLNRVKHLIQLFNDSSNDEQEQD